MPISPSDFVLHHGSVEHFIADAFVTTQWGANIRGNVFIFDRWVVVQRAEDEHLVFPSESVLEIGTAQYSGSILNGTITIRINSNANSADPLILTGEIRTYRDWVSVTPTNPPGPPRLFSRDNVVEIQILP